VVIFTGMSAASRPSSATRHKNQILQLQESLPFRSLRRTASFRKRRRLLIVKFGGSSLSNPKRINLAVASVALEYAHGNHVVVVVSAVGNMTDQLLQLTNGGAELVETDKDDILAMGERTSARIFAASLKSRGMQARYYDPSDRDWPIITDNNFLNANPLKAKSIQRIRRYLKPALDDGVVPVIGGFIGRTTDGRISTLGRGGSDTTALLLAMALEADEVVLVTNVPGILSADPALVRNARVLTRIDMKTLTGIADTGTKFIHRKALQFKDPSINIRVISNTTGKLDARGTLVTGVSIPELEVTVNNPHPVASVTIIGTGLPHQPALVQKISKLAGQNLVAVSQDRDSAILYIKQTEKLRQQIAKLHDAVLNDPHGIALAARMGMALITVRSIGLEERPGVVARISDALRSANINMFGVLTITSSVLVFVDWKVRRKAAILIKSSLEKN
jgi:aspartate kinase